MADFDQIVFKKKRFSDLLEEIYTRSKTKETQLSNLIEQLKEMIHNTADATMMVPLIANYMDLNLKNDDLLIKMTAIVQKAMDRASDGGDSSLTDQEREDLLKIAQEHVAEKQAVVNKNLPNA